MKIKTPTKVVLFVAFAMMVVCGNGINDVHATCVRGTLPPFKGQPYTEITDPDYRSMSMVLANEDCPLTGQAFYDGNFVGITVDKYRDDVYDRVSDSQLLCPETCEPETVTVLVSSEFIPSESESEITFVECVTAENLG